jgi:hypothetical protein
MDDDPLDSPRERLALSIRQPWATLVVAGLKRIEIRKWSTKHRGEIYLHAGKLIDKREEGWELVPDEHRESTECRGGLVGKARLVDCIAYRDPAHFARDSGLHRCPPEWFAPPVLYGFVFEAAQEIPFEPVRGDLHFFRIPAE